MSATATVEDAYRAAQEAALIVRHETPGRLSVEGADRLDLLHRMSTNDLEHLPELRARKTVFTDPVGRTIDVVTVLSLPEQLLLLTTAGRATVLRDWLNRHIFFQDDVQLEVLEDEWDLFGAYGPQAAEQLQLEAPPKGRVTRTETKLAWAVEEPLPGYLILLLSGEQAGGAAAYADEPAGRQAYEVLRIEAGLAKMGQDILEDSIPLEVGLWEAVSFEKGCYVGQEIIARMESRGKLAKQLVGLKLEAEAELGTVLLQDGRQVGSLTSIARSPLLGWIGLGTVRTKALSGGEAELRTGETVLLVDLPFATGIPSRVAAHT